MYDEESRKYQQENDLHTAEVNAMTVHNVVVKRLKHQKLQRELVSVSIVPRWKFASKAILAVLVIIAQGVLHSTDYFGYPVNVNIEFSQNETVIPPQLALGFEKNVLDPNNITFNEDLFRKAINLKEHISNVFIARAGLVLKQLYSEELKTFIATAIKAVSCHGQVFFVIDYSTFVNVWEFSGEYVYGGMSQLFVMIEFTGIPDNIGNYSVIVVDNGLIDDLSHLTAMGLGQNYVSYKKSNGKSLPWPYPMNCVNYRAIGYESQRDCICKCTKSRSKLIPLLISTTEDEHYNYTRKLTPDYEKCRKKCKKPDCEKNVFSVKNNFKHSRLFAVAVMVPSQGELRSWEEPRYKWWTFAIMLGSLPGLWLGMSMLDVVSKPSDLLWKKYG